MIESALTSTAEASPECSYVSRLATTQQGECVALQPLDTSQDRATLVARKHETYLLIYSTDNFQTVLKLEEVNERLVAQYIFPRATQAELSVVEFRAREARQAAAQHAEAVCERMQPSMQLQLNGTSNKQVLLHS